MRGSGVFWPLSLPVLVVLGLLLAVMAGTLVYAYERIGIDRSWLLALLGLSIVGSTVNLPVARLRSSVVLGPQVIRVYGIRYLVPAVRQRRVTVIAVNVGGALVPAGVAAFLIAHEHLGTRALVAVGIVAAVCLLLARPVKGVGIVLPGLVPPVVAAITALAISEPLAPALAYVAGVLGTLVGADLLNLPRIRKLGAPASAVGGPEPGAGGLGPALVVAAEDLARPHPAPAGWQQRLGQAGVEERELAPLVDHARLGDEDLLRLARLRCCKGTDERLVVRVELVEPAPGGDHQLPLAADAAVAGHERGRLRSGVEVAQGLQRLPLAFQPRADPQALAERAEPRPGEPGADLVAVVAPALRHAHHDHQPAAVPTGGDALEVVDALAAADQQLPGRGRKPPARLPADPVPLQPALGGAASDRLARGERAAGPPRDRRRNKSGATTGLSIAGPDAVGIECPQGLQGLAVRHLGHRDVHRRTAGPAPGRGRHHLGGPLAGMHGDQLEGADPAAGAQDRTGGDQRDRFAGRQAHALAPAGTVPVPGAGAVVHALDEPPRLVRHDHQQAPRRRGDVAAATAARQPHLGGVGGPDPGGVQVDVAAGQQADRPRERAGPQRAVQVRRVAHGHHRPARRLVAQQTVFERADGAWRMGGDGQREGQQRQPHADEHHLAVADLPGGAGHHQLPPGQIRLSHGRRPPMRPGPPGSPPGRRPRAPSGRATPGSPRAWRWLARSPGRRRRRAAGSGSPRCRPAPRPRRSPCRRRRSPPARCRGCPTPARCRGGWSAPERSAVGAARPRPRAGSSSRNRW